MFGRFHSGKSALQGNLHTVQVQVCARKHGKHRNRLFILIKKLVEDLVGPVAVSRKNRLGKVKDAGLQILRYELIYRLRGNLTASRVGTQLFQFVQHRLHIAAAKLYHAAGIWLGYFASALFCAGTDQFFHLLRRAAAKRHKHAEFSRFREKFLPVLVAPLVKIK